MTLTTEELREQDAQNRLSCGEAFKRHGGQFPCAPDCPCALTIEILALRAEVERLRGALEAIAEQPLSVELSSDERLAAAFDDGYDLCVEDARAALGETP